jgi:hypothetical protein
MEIGNLFHFSVAQRLSLSMVVGSLSYYPTWVPIFSTAVIDATSNNFSKSIDSLSTVIGLPCHGHQNFKKIGIEILASRSPFPAPCSRASFPLVPA